MSDKLSVETIRSKIGAAYRLSLRRRSNARERGDGTGAYRVDETARVAALTDAEREALRVFLHRSSVKEVARAIGKSPHTAEQRLARARRRLGVARSIDAAHMLARVEGSTYGTAVYAPSDVAEREADEDRLVPAEEVDAPNWSLPFPTKGRPWNAASPWTRLAWIALGILAATVSALLTAALMETVSRIVRQHL